MERDSSVFVGLCPSLATSVGVFRFSPIPPSLLYKRSCRSFSVTHNDVPCYGSSKGEIGDVMKATREAGFTLVELMVTLSVVAVLLSAGAPSFSAMIKNNRLSTESYEMHTLLGAAHSEALRQRTAVTVCRSENAIDCSTGDWGAGYMAFIDLDKDGRLDDDEQLLGYRVPNTLGIVVSYNLEGDVLLFGANGNTDNSDATFSFCDDRGAVDARGLIVSVIGSVRPIARSESKGPAHIGRDHARSDINCNAT